MIRRRLTGLLATGAIAAILVGLPAVLLAVGYGTLPRISSWTDLVEVAMRRDDGTLALLVLKTVGWIAWAILAVLILTEIIALLPGIRPRELPGLHLPQTAARALVAAAAALFVALPTSATPAYAAPTRPPVVTATRTVVAATQNTATHQAHAPGGESADAPAHPGPTVKTRPYTVKRGESLWSIAAQELGSGRRYTEIAALNATLLDGKGGLGWANDNADMALNAGGTPAFTNFNSQSVTSGSERELTPAWLLQAQYDYLGLGSKSVANVGSLTCIYVSGGCIITAAVPAGSSGVTQNIQQFKVGLNYKFGANPLAGWPTVPPVKAPPMLSAGL